MLKQYFSTNEKTLTLKAAAAFSEILKNVSKDVHYRYMKKLSQNLKSVSFTPLQ